MRGKGLVVGRWQQRGRQEHGLVKNCEPQRSRSFNKSNSLEVKIRNIDDSESLLDFKVQRMCEGKQSPLGGCLSTLSFVHTWIYSKTLGISFTTGESYCLHGESVSAQMRKWHVLFPPPLSLVYGQLYPLLWFQFTCNWWLPILDL